ncbi:hypothetical protein [Nesterenkonia sp. CL21]|uniref:hypothetical protein n=1 Tax=unclassified Nesterenkonia TaxID=2629769 RepID=UPI00287A185E|nr:hypothetical protein [Nesterenkonia sp. CL21]MDS2172533.1 hypothetical protein [Nesterenkonia sp. CL21]
MEIITALGGGTFIIAAITMLGQGIRKAWTGQFRREREAVRDMRQRRDEVLDRLKAAETRREEAEELARTERIRADRRVRILSEYASELRRFCINHGTPIGDLPPWPKTDR